MQTLQVGARNSNIVDLKSQVSFYFCNDIDLLCSHVYLQGEMFVLFVVCMSFVSKA